MKKTTTHTSSVLTRFGGPSLALCKPHAFVSDTTSIMYVYISTSIVNWAHCPLGKNEGPLLKMLNSPADGTCAGGLVCLPGPLAWLVNKFSTRGHTKLLQPSGEETLVPPGGLFNILGSGPSFFSTFCRWVTVMCCYNMYKCDIQVLHLSCIHIHTRLVWLLWWFVIRILQNIQIFCNVNHVMLHGM